MKLKTFSHSYLDKNRFDTFCKMCQVRNGMNEDSLCQSFVVDVAHGITGGMFLTSIHSA